MQRTLSLAALVTLIAWAGCKQAGKTEPSRTSEPGSPTDTSGPKTLPPSPAQEPGQVQTIAQQDVEALMARWLEAQNQGDFPAYSDCYATRFEGIKRFGERTTSFDRKGWLADRERMFKRPMTVEAQGMVIETFAQTAIVRFTQKWASGAYEDVGPKQIIVMREGDALRITREEMLSSTVVSSPELARTGLASDKSTGFGFLIDAGGSYMLAEALQGEELSRHGPLELASNDAVVVVKTRLDARNLSPEAASWIGRRVRSGTCLATVTSLWAIARVVPHFGERAEWRGMSDDGEESRPYTDAQIAQAAWSMAGTSVAAELAFDKQESCDRAPFAYPESDPWPLEAEAVHDPALAALAISAFRKTESYAKIQEDYREQVAASERAGSWDLDGAAGPRVAIFRHPRTGAMTALVYASAGRGCGEFEGELAASFDIKTARAQSTAKFVPLTDELSAPAEILGAYDIDRDGELEYVVSMGYAPDMALIDKQGQDIYRASIPYHDCRC